jgi:hypothetical protein
MFIVNLLFKKRISKYGRKYCFKQPTSNSASPPFGLMFFGIGTGTFTFSQAMDWLFPKTEPLTIQAHKRQSKLFSAHFAKDFHENHFDEVTVCSLSVTCYLLVEYHQEAHSRTGRWEDLSS